MLDGLAPIIIFQLYKNITTDTTVVKNGIPITSKTTQRQTFAVIPIYLDEKLTGLQIDSESKNIDIETQPSALVTGDAGPTNQQPLGAVTTIMLKGKSTSIGLNILLALSETLLDKLASQEYGVTYMNGAVTVFGGLIHGFSYDAGNANDDLYRIKLEISRGRKASKSVDVAQYPSATRLASAPGAIPAPNSSTVTVPPQGANAGQSVIQPNVTQQRL